MQHPRARALGDDAVSSVKRAINTSRSAGAIYNAGRRESARIGKRAVCTAAHACVRASVPTGRHLVHQALEALTARERLQRNFLFAYLHRDRAAAACAAHANTRSSSRYSLFTKSAEDRASSRERETDRARSRRRGNRGRAARGERVYSGTPARR